MRKRILTTIFITFIIMCLNFNIVFAKIQTISSYYYVYNNNNLLTRTTVDNISSFGETLSVGGYDLIFNIATENTYNENKECKDLYYLYLKNLDTNNPKKIITMSYYADTRELLFYDDYGILNKNIIEECTELINNYANNGDLETGALECYKKISKYINDSQKLNIQSLDSLKIANPFSKTTYPIKNVFLIGGIIILLLGFRRNQDFVID